LRTNLFWLVTILLTACSPDAAEQMMMPVKDASIDMILPKRDPTDHPDIRTLNYYGGPLLTNIEVVTVVWQGDEATGQFFQDYTDWVVHSDEFWIAGLKEYGIGKGTTLGYFVIPEAKPTSIDDSQITAKIKTYIGSGLLPPPTSNKTIYSVVVPKGTTETMFGGKGCDVYDGYHSEIKVSPPGGGAAFYVPYAINLQCPGQDDLGTEETISHELGESATDPHPGTKPGYVASGAPLGNENGDLCNPLSVSFKVDRIVDGGASDTITYNASRLWSNAAATAGNQDPCQPAPLSHPYYNTAIDPNDPTFDVPSDPKGKDYMVKIEPYAFGDVGKIKWALDVNPPDGVTMNPQSGENMPGETIWMTVHVDPSAATGGAAFIIASQAAVGGINYWQATLNLQ
jgi:hypothetical protein